MMHIVSPTTLIYAQLGCLGELVASLPMHITLGQIQITKTSNFV